MVLLLFYNTAVLWKRASHDHWIQYGCGVQQQDLSCPDRGCPGDNPYTLTLLYHGGAILARIKTNYGSLFPQKLTERQIQDLMERQHKKMMTDLRSGKFAAVTWLEPSKPFASDLLSPDKTFDQLILDYLEGQDQPSEK